MLVNKVFPHPGCPLTNNTLSKIDFDLIALLNIDLKFS